MDGRLKHKDVEAEELEKKRLLDACRAVQTTTIERLCKARAEAKFTWIMPSRSQRCIYMNATAASIEWMPNGCIVNIPVECAEGYATLRHTFTARIKYMCVGISFSLVAELW